MHTQPAIGGMQSGSSVGTRTRRIHSFARSDADLYAQSVIINEIFASELTRKFIKRALSVGTVRFTLVGGCLREKK